MEQAVTWSQLHSLPNPNSLIVFLLDRVTLAVPEEQGLSFEHLLFIFDIYGFQVVLRLNESSFILYFI